MQTRVSLLVFMTPRGIVPLFLIRFAHKNAGRGSPVVLAPLRATSAPPFDSP